MKVNRKLSHDELLNKFIEENKGVTVINWQPLIADDCRVYAKEGQPIIRVDLADGNWLRVYISKEYNEISWY